MNSALSEIISVKQRFGRSVNLERDFYSRVSLNGYVLTTTARQAFGRLLQAYKNPDAERAFTLTGPYGSGKSTFALFAAKAFDSRTYNEISPAHDILQSKADELWKTFHNVETPIAFLPILISGSRESLATAILRGIKTALENTADKTLKPQIAHVKVLEKADPVTGKQILKLLNDIAHSINENRNQKAGLLLVIDELGKLLEFAAIRPEESDIFLLQELAEATKSFDVPFFLVTILHQAFDRYAERLGRREREEWKKVQGRFEDLPFQEPNEQVLHILQNAFEINEKAPEAKEIRKYGQNLAERSFELGLCGKFKKHACSDLLQSCMPLHPTVALTLGHIFRRFGQNERSLFAFLTSGEAFGLNDFLRNTAWDRNAPKTARLDRVYDYLVSAMGSALYSGPESRKWAEIDTTLHRLINPTEVEVRVIKVIGLLGLIGELGNLKSSLDVVQYALESGSVSREEVSGAVKKLERQSILTHRKFNGTFAIWEGSDVDLEERFREAEKHIDSNLSLAKVLTENFEPRPLVAKRHSEETGTLRFFEIIYTDSDNFADVSQLVSEEADGRIIYILIGNETERNKFIEHLQETIIPPAMIAAVPQNLANLREAVYNAACWQWVSRNTPELESDRTARSELNVRIFDAEQIVAQFLNGLHTNVSKKNCRWFFDNGEAEISSPRALQERLSGIFDRLFDQSPILKNELVNRRNLSSAATAARRLLFEAMYLKADQPQLGIEGYPPQLSIYLSILNKTGMHRKESGRYGFYPPPEENTENTAIVWNRIVSFFEETERERKTIAELFDILRQPPFGLKDGVIPVLLLAVVVYFDSEAALYENGSFIPKLTLPILERLCKKPETFTVQLCRIGEVKTQVIGKLAETILPENVSSDKKALEVLTLVRPLVRFVNDLDQFTKLTRRISPKAQKIRQVLIAAREPDKLLFKQLPEACGFKEISGDADLTAADVERFAKKLQEGLSEIKRAYPNLLLELEQMIASAFRIEKSGDELRKELTTHIQLLGDYAASPKLKTFILRSKDTEADFHTWLESLGALLGGKPVPMWNDDDITRFEINLADTARSFANLEALAFELKNRKPEDLNGNTEFLRLSLTRLGEIEREEVLAISKEEKEKVLSLEETVEEAFKQAGLNGNVKLRLTVLANLSYKLLSEEGIEKSASD